MPSITASTPRRLLAGLCPFCSSHATAEALAGAAGTLCYARLEGDLTL